ncbi:MAG: protein kinase [Fuerstiella sp.]
MKFRCPNCNHAIHILDRSDPEATLVQSDVTCPSCESRFSLKPAEEETSLPDKISSVGHFEIRRLLGHGSYGAVFLAWDPELDRLVALKVPRETSSPRKSSRSFISEARAAAGIQHPNVMSIYEIGEYQSGHYIACQYVEGVTLKQWLQERECSIQQAVKMMMAICRGVQAAHEKNVVHRDLKPGNILVDVNGNPVVADFGLARRESQGQVTLTVEGQLIGTPAYMSPEQARGDVSAIGPLSDVFSLGVILYELLSRERPFQATESQTVLHNILSEDALPLRRVVHGLPADLETICMKAMQKNPAERYQSAQDFLQDLQCFLDGKPIAARRTSQFELIYRRLRKYPVATVGVLCLLILSGTLLVIVLKDGDSVAVGNPERATNSGSDSELSVEAEQEKSTEVPLTEVSLNLIGRLDERLGQIRWAIAPLDLTTRLPLAEEVLRVEGQESIQARLKPGEYLVLVEIEGFGFAEVYRTVPKSISDPAVMPLQTRLPWTPNQAGDGILWAPVVVQRFQDVTAGMVKVPAGIFTSGDGSPQSPRTERRVSAFWIDAHEVTWSEYYDALDRDLPENVEGTNAAHSMNWFQAVEWSENLGKRLPTSQEFEYLGTNLGTSEFPSGQAQDYDMTSWTYEAAGRPKSDKVGLLSIYGIHSNVAEWTDSSFTPFTMSGRYPDVVLRKIQESRAVRGGPVQQGRNVRGEFEVWPTVRSISGWNALTTFDDEIGFRCAVSEKPRFIHLLKENNGDSKSEQAGGSESAVKKSDKGSDD